MEIVKGQVVFSRAGRDAAKAYVVVGRQDDRLLLADGEKRTLASPKPKNIRHINPSRTVLPPGQADTDQDLRTALQSYVKAHGPQTQGGEKLV